MPIDRIIGRRHPRNLVGPASDWLISDSNVHLSPFGPLAGKGPGRCLKPAHRHGPGHESEAQAASRIA